MKLLYVCREHPEKLPPIVSFVLASRDLGFNVDVVSFFDGEDSFKIDIKSEHKSYLQFCKYLKSIENDYDVIVFGSLDSTFYFYPYIIKSNKNLVLHIHELYDKFYFHTKWLKFISSSFIDIIVSNNMRASYLYGTGILNKLPKFLDNIPYHIKKSDFQEVPSDFVVNSNYIIYQGHILPDRKLDIIEKSIYDFTDFKLVVVGKNHTNFKFSEDTVIFNWVPPPNYLYLTKNASAGILKYDHTSLNNLFCAPNKIYEYLTFDLPLISNNNPTLDYFINFNRLGVIHNDEAYSIKTAFEKLSKDYDLYKKNACDINFKSYYKNQLLSILLSIKACL